MNEYLKFSYYSSSYASQIPEHPVHSSPKQEQCSSPGPLNMYNQPSQSPETLISLDCENRIPTTKQQSSQQQQQQQQHSHTPQPPSQHAHAQQAPSVQQSPQEHQSQQHVITDDQRIPRNGSNWEPLTPPQ